MLACADHATKIAEQLGSKLPIASNLYKFPGATKQNADRKVGYYVADLLALKLARLPAAS
jgi:hypothetical protein